MRTLEQQRREQAAKVEAARAAAEEEEREWLAAAGARAGTARRMGYRRMGSLDPAEAGRRAVTAGEPALRPALARFRHEAARLDRLTRELGGRPVATT